MNYREFWDGFLKIRSGNFIPKVTVIRQNVLNSFGWDRLVSA